MRDLGLMFLIVAGAAAVTGCGNNCGEADCTPAGFYSYIPAGLPSPLVEVTADSPCVATLFPQGDAPTGLTVTDDTASQGAVCVLHGRLANGQVVTATVTFGRREAGCCPGFTPSGGQFTLPDSGTDGG